MSSMSAPQWCGFAAALLPRQPHLPGVARDSDDPEVARVQIQKATFFYMNIPQYYPLNNMIEYLNVLFLCWEVYRGYSVSGRTDE